MIFRIMHITEETLSEMEEIKEALTESGAVSSLMLSTLGVFAISAIFAIFIA